MAAERSQLDAPPFFHYGGDTPRMVRWTFGCLAVLVGLYSLAYDPGFVFRWLGFVLLGAALKTSYDLLATGRARMRLDGSALTAALLVMTVPPNTPFVPLFHALILAIVLGRMPSTGTRHLNLNPMLLGRLFLMVAYGPQIVNWTRRGLDPDAVTTVTPLELFHSEGATVSLRSLLSGRIGGSWEELYELVPGGPGELFGPVILVLGVLLFRKGVISWRPGVSFLLAFLGTCAVLREPLLFNLFSGAVIFSAVFIASDPRTSPVSVGGQWAAGIVAGVVNALVRRYTVYSEGIVFAFLTANLLSPTLDRAAFALRGLVLRRRRARFETRQADIASTDRPA